MSNKQLIVFAGGALALGAMLHWVYTRSANRAMKEEARGAALLEMLPLRDYIAATLEDPARAQVFRRHVALVRQSWEKLKPHRLEMCAHVMYAKLRQEDPSVGDVFDKQLDWQAQERIFTVMIGNLVSRLDEPTTGGLLDTLTRLGRRHHELGVSPKQYNSMQRAILASLEELLGDEWSSDYSDAWASIFAFITHVMIKAAAEPAGADGSAGTEAKNATKDNALGGGCPMPFRNKYLTSLKEADKAPADGHNLQRFQPPASSGKIEEESS